MRNRHIILALLAALSLMLTAPIASAGQRVALAIGVSAYRSSPLPSPAKDAAETARALAGFGFEVTLVRDPNASDFRAAVDAFVERARGAEAAIIYFSGHGFQMNGEVYLTATDSRMDRPDMVLRDDFAVNAILDRLQGAGVDFKFVIVDACRGNPFLEGNARGALAAANAGRAERRRAVTNALVSFSSASGQLSQDWGGSVGLSLYTSALLDVLRRADRIEVRDLTQQTRALVEERVARRGANAQNPWEGSSLVRPIQLVRGQAAPVIAFETRRGRDVAGFDRPGAMAGEGSAARSQTRGRNSDLNSAEGLADGRTRAWEYNVASSGVTQIASGRPGQSSRGRYGTAEWR